MTGLDEARALMQRADDCGPPTYALLDERYACAVEFGTYCQRAARIAIDEMERMAASGEGRGHPINKCNFTTSKAEVWR